MKTISRVISSAVMLALTVGLCIFASKFPAVFNLWYPAFSQWILGVVGDVTSKVAFPIWEVLAAFLLLWGVVTLFRGIVKHKILRWLSGLLWGVSFGVFLFTLFWGAGHFGLTKTERIVTVREYSVTELQEAAVFYGQMASKYAGQGDFSDFSALTEKANDGYAALSQKYDCIPDTEVPVKKLLFSRLYSHMGTTGIFVPMTSEAGVSADCYPISLPFTMCHEMAHRLGANAEEDANFCAFLACASNPDPSFQYSAYYSAFLYCYNALCEESPDAASAVWSGLSQQVQSDIRGASDHYAPYEGKAQEAAQSVNNAYLKAMGQEGGVKSYGIVSDALIAWYQQNR